MKLKETLMKLSTLFSSWKHLVPFHVSSLYPFQFSKAVRCILSTVRFYHQLSHIWASEMWLLTAETKARKKKKKKERKFQRFFTPEFIS